jgi:ElaB/YqjD/DUF883 family membrane-anchored ribosome-binding protein
MAKRPTKRVKATATDAVSGMRSVIDSAEELLETLREEQGPAVERMREKVSATIENARDRLSEVDVPELASGAIDSTVVFVRSDPWRAVAIGALGLLAV